VDTSRIGRGLRAIRIRAGVTQATLASRARVPRVVVASIERGDLVRVRVGQLAAVAGSLGADLDVIVRWNGTELDRLLHAGHSAMHEIIAGLLIADGWEVVPERSFSSWGERGVIDIVAWHAPTRTLLIVELKTEIVEVQLLIGKVDQYRRLAPNAVEELGWIPRQVAAWVVVAESPTNHRRLADHATVLRAAFPDDGRKVRAWRRNPSGPLRALSFLSDARLANRTAARSSRRRVRAGRSGSRAPETGPRTDHVSRPERT
jgi:transcriptional regulator with XRE-family HTH domain